MATGTTEIAFHACSLYLTLGVHGGQPASFSVRVGVRVRVRAG